MSVIETVWLICSLYRQFPARAPMANTSEFASIKAHYASVEPGYGRTATEQGYYQAAAMMMTFVVAIGGGLVTGMILRLPIFGKVHNDHLFDDTLSWELPDEEEANHVPSASEPMYLSHMQNKMQWLDRPTTEDVHSNQSLHQIPLNSLC